MRSYGDGSSDEKHETPAEAPRYEPPAIEWEEQLHAVARFAAACARRPAESPDCELGGALSS